MRQPADNRWTLPALVCDDAGVARWIDVHWPAEQRGGMLLSPRLPAGSLRFRRSEPGYAADWHVAGEPVLIVVRQGTLRIGLPDGATRQFSPGDAFIAADRAPVDPARAPGTFGHNASVVGDTPLLALHIKLADFDPVAGT